MRFVVKLSIPALALFVLTSVSCSDPLKPSEDAGPLNVTRLSVGESGGEWTYLTYACAQPDPTNDNEIEFRWRLFNASGIQTHAGSWYNGEDFPNCATQMMMPLVPHRLRDHTKEFLDLEVYSNGDRTFSHRYYFNQNGATFSGFYQWGNPPNEQRKYMYLTLDWSPISYPVHHITMDLDGPVVGRSRLVEVRAYSEQGVELFNQGPVGWTSQNPELATVNSAAQVTGTVPWQRYAGLVTGVSTGGATTAYAMLTASLPATYGNYSSLVRIQNSLPGAGVLLQGPTTLGYDSGTCTWTANPMGGTPPYSYQWTVNGYFDGGQAQTMNNESFSNIWTIRVDATDFYGESASAEINVNYTPQQPPCAG
jgi:hypothetical protein